jgi:hypothetical protein
MKGLDACDAATREALGGAENGGAPENARAPLPRAITRIALSAGAIARGPLANVALSVPLTLLSQLRPQEESARGVPFPVGRWLQDSSGLVAVRGGAANVLTIRYHAGRVGVLASPPAGRTAKLWILRDENWLSGRAPGEDVRLDEHGASYVELDGTRLYIVDREGGDHIYKFSPEAPGVTLHALTFDDPSGD